MPATRSPKAIGQYGWRDADIGVECRACGVVAVFCDFEAVARFRERGWSLAVDDAVRRFRCRCGSREVRLRPVPIAMRPRPIPVRPAPLRAIYREEARSLRRRGTLPFPEQAAIEAALDTLARAIHARRYGGEAVARGAVAAALGLLRPSCYRQDDLDAFVGELDRLGDSFGGHVDTLLTGIVRQLGMRR